VAGRAAQISALMGGPPSRGMENYKPKVRTGWRVRASTGSSPDQVLSYLGIEKADSANYPWPHRRIDLPSGIGRGFGPARIAGRLTREAYAKQPRGEQFQSAAALSAEQD
jgi:hypothetical protein